MRKPSLRVSYGGLRSCVRSLGLPIVLPFAVAAAAAAQVTPPACPAAMQATPPAPVRVLDFDHCVAVCEASIDLADCVQCNGCDGLVGSGAEVVGGCQKEFFVIGRDGWAFRPEANDPDDHQAPSNYLRLPAEWVPLDAGGISLWLGLDRVYGNRPRRQFAVFDSDNTGARRLFLGTSHVAGSPRPWRLELEAYESQSANLFQPDMMEWSAGEWHHVLVTWGAATVEYYMDGRLAGSAPRPANFPSDFPPGPWLYLMGSNRPGFLRTATGDLRLDSFRVFDQHLSQAEAVALYRQELLAGSSGPTVDSFPLRMSLLMPKDGYGLESLATSDGSAYTRRTMCAPSRQLWQLRLESVDTSGLSAPVRIVINNTAAIHRQPSMSVNRRTGARWLRWRDLPLPEIELDPETMRPRLVLPEEPVETVDVVVELRPGDDREIEGRIEVDLSSRTWSLSEVKFPRLGGLAPVDGDPEATWLVLPDEDWGRYLEDPFVNGLPGQLSVEYSPTEPKYPSKALGMQWLALVNAETERHGVYLGAHDGGAWLKSLQARHSVKDWVVASNRDPGIDVEVQLYAEGIGETDNDFSTREGAANPWPAVIGIHDGSWYDMARRYRRFALDQPWAGAGPLTDRVATGDSPAWLRDVGLLKAGTVPHQAVCVERGAAGNEPALCGQTTAGPMVVCGVGLASRSTYGCSADTSVPCLRCLDSAECQGVGSTATENCLDADGADAATGLVLWHHVRWGEGSCNQPDDLPFLPPDGALERELDLASANGMPLAIYHLPYMWDIARNCADSPEQLLLEPFPKPGCENFWLTRRGATAVTVARNGQPRGRLANLPDKPAAQCTGSHNDWLHGTWMCPASRAWQTLFTDEVRSLLELETAAGNRLAGIYLDTLPAAVPRMCFAERHDHRPGGGDHWVRGMREMLADLRAAKHPGQGFYGEGFAEPYLDLVDGYLTYQSALGRGLPLAQAVYHDHAFFMGRAVPPGDLASKIAVQGRIFSWGGMPGFDNSASADPDRRKLNGYMRRLGRARRTFRDYQVLGDMLRPLAAQEGVDPAVRLPRLTRLDPRRRIRPVTDLEFPALTAPAVAVTAWRFEGRTGILVTSLEAATGQPGQTRRVAIPLARSRLELGAQSLEVRLLEVPASGSTPVATGLGFLPNASDGHVLLEIDPEEVVLIELRPH